jgi:cation diffusion facilitator family transporter
MHTHSIDHFRHSHNFAHDTQLAEKNTRNVMWLTAIMMLVEIVAGTLYGSMALLADGWHMATHVAAFGITLFAYSYARKHADNPQFTFGTGKVSVLGGFTSAVALSMVALMMAIESLMRFFQPHQIQFNEAILVAVIGLLVNLVSGFMLHDHHHEHDHDHDHHEHHAHHDHEHEHHHDHNLRAAYFHVLADALTSVFAIIALLAGKYYGWVWLDPVMGLVGAAVITRWAWGLMQDTSHILLDGSVDAHTRKAIKTAIENDADNRISDLHIWQVSPQHFSASISLVTHEPRSPGHYKNLLRDIPRLSHIVVEVIECTDKH